jgi:hypothetical protein
MIQFCKVKGNCTACFSKVFVYLYKRLFSVNILMILKMKRGIVYAGK